MVLAMFAMGAAVLAVFVGLPVFLALILTRHSETLAVTHVTRRLVPLGPDDDARLGPGVDRGGHSVAGREVTDVSVEQLPLEVLPRIVRYAAGWCRVSFCLAALAVLPYLAFLSVDLGRRPLGLDVCLGTTGIALSFAHAITRSSLLSASRRAPRLAIVVGVLTIGYALATLGAIALVFNVPPPSDSTWSMIVLDSPLSMPALLLALLWMVLGVSLVVSARQLRVWRQQLAVDD